jgi:hypothetical protein
VYQAEVIEALRLCSVHAVALTFFLAIYLCISLGSLFLALTGILLLVLSYGPATMIYLYVLKIDYLTEAHIFTFFLLCVISSEYLTFMVDTWTFSERITLYEGSVSRRLAFTWRTTLKRLGILTVLISSIAISLIYTSPHIPV